MDARDEDRVRIQALSEKVQEQEKEIEALKNPLTAVTIFLDSQIGRTLIEKEGRLRIAMETIQKAESLEDVQIIAESALK